MPATKYDKAVKLLRELKDSKGEKVGAMALRHMVMRKIGGDINRTIVPYLKFMRELNLIEDIGNQHFLIKV